MRLPKNRKRPVGAILDPSGHHLGSGFNEPHGDYLRRSRHFTCVVGKGHLHLWVVHVTRAETELEPGH